MCKIANTRRANGRYIFRRRVHFRNLISKPVELALKTADPGTARYRAAFLSARFVEIKVCVDAMLETGRPLTGVEIEALFRRALERELQSWVHSAYQNEAWSASVPEVAAEIADACRQLRGPVRPRAPQKTPSYQDADDARFNGPQTYTGQIMDMLSDEAVRAELAAIGAPASSENLETARTHLIRGKLSACMRAQQLFEDEVLDAPEPVRALTANLGAPSPEVAALLGDATNQQPATSQSPVQALPSEGLFLVYDPRRFGDVIDEVIAALKSEGVWKGDTAQQRRIMETFAWITGNRPLGSYTHIDCATFKTALQKLPKKFRFGSLTHGAMARPFAEVMAELPPVSPADRRSHKTTNRDLSTMATVAKRLAETSWKPRMAGAAIMSFDTSRIAIKQSASIDTRPPWKKVHLECLFHSPLYLGGGDALQRLIVPKGAARVWHDAAYFAPLIWYYTGACREEICGLEIADITIDHPVPHFEIKDNLTRGRDGEVAGEKREARRRHLPIHPQLIRLGFIDYVKAIRDEGHVALFPELYRHIEKRGGGFFYDRAWQHMVDYIEDRHPIPRNPLGKGPDIHSIRGLSSSFYEVEGINELIRADVMGHARQGTNGKHYSKRLETEGLDVVIAERLDFICKYVPVITGDVPAFPIRLLPLDKRSRTGTSRNCKRRSDAKPLPEPAPD